MKFIDEVIIKIKAGHGGAGAVSFRREKFEPMGGPDGGDGGRGGNIIIEADSGLATLIDFRYRKNYTAENGRNGKGAQQFGKAGDDIILKVPVGTVVKTAPERDAEGNDIDQGTVIVDLTEPGMQHTLCKGGRGGKGNMFFATSTNQAPKYSQPGEEGEAAVIKLELKLLADVGLVGLPNAGKSSLIASISAARPKIADYPFTTLAPNLGVVKIEDRASFVVADIPGLIEGASQGHGLGNKFLKHIERTKILVHLVDCSDGQEFKDNYKIITNEIKNSPYDLSQKPVLIALNKIDSCSERHDVLQFKKQLEKNGHRVFVTSSLSKEGIEELLRELQYMIFAPKKEVY